MAQRPSWECRTCCKAWPCEPARGQMKTEMDGTSLRIFMWLQLEQAAGELTTMTVAVAYERFLAWT